MGSVDCASVMLFSLGVPRGKCLLADSLHCLLVTENAEFSANYKSHSLVCAVLKSK